MIGTLLFNHKAEGRDHHQPHLKYRDKIEQGKRLGPL